MLVINARYNVQYKTSMSINISNSPNLSCILTLPTPCPSSIRFPNWCPISTLSAIMVRDRGSCFSDGIFIRFTKGSPSASESTSILLTMPATAMWVSALKIHTISYNKKKLRSQISFYILSNSFPERINFVPFNWFCVVLVFRKISFCTVLVVRKIYFASYLFSVQLIFAPYSFFAQLIFAPYLFFAIQLIFAVELM